MLPTLSYECSEFLAASGGRPLLKNLPRLRDGFVKVKVRHQRATNPFIENFNSAFVNEKPNLLQRSVVVHGEASFVPSTDPNLEPFYVFPVDGFRYMYNPHASTHAYQETFDKLLSNVGQSAPELFQSILKYDYVFDKLEDGIQSGSEIIFFGIPYYFALRKSIIDDYAGFCRT